MSSGKRLTNEEVLKRIRKKCLEKDIEFIGFNNDENFYKNNKTYLKLKCNKCGNIWNTTSYEKFMSGRGCPNCSKTKKITGKEAVKRILKKCEEKNYEFIGFVSGKFNNIGEKLTLRCKKCGEIWNTTTFNNLVNQKRNSHSCGRKNPISMPIILNETNAINAINKKLKNSSLRFVSFVNNKYIGRTKTHILLKCEKCGEINEYSYKMLISKNSVPQCKSCEYGNKLSNETAIEKIKEKCEKLNYEFLGFNNDKNRYENKNTYLILKCNVCGTIWRTTTYYSFIHNDIKCLGCINSWKMEKEIESLLRENNIKFIPQCRNKVLPWLKHKMSLSLDFYLPEYKIAIECQGRQHFEPVFDFGGEKSFKESIERDKKKLILCKKHNVKLIYYDSEHGHKNFLNEKVYNTKEEIINVLKLNNYNYE